MKTTRIFKPAKRFRFWFLTVCLVLGSQDVRAQTAVKPAGPSPVANVAAVMRRNLRLSDFNVHDPWILAHAPSKSYYLYTSNNVRATGISRPGTIAYRRRSMLPDSYGLPRRSSWQTRSSLWSTVEGPLVDRGRAVIQRSKIVLYASRRHLGRQPRGLGARGA